MDDTIYVCYCLNKTYELYTINSIQSLIDNNINNNEYYIYIIHDGSINIEPFIDQLQLSDDIVIDFIMFDKKYDFYCDSYIQKPAYYRLFIADLLPDYIEKCIYLDCDTYILNSLDLLYSINLGKKTYGMVKYTKPKWEDHPYNDGVLLINLKKIRKEKITKKYIKFMNEHKYLKQHDETVINLVHVDDVKKISNIFNYFNVSPTADQRWLNSIKDDVYIIHDFSANKLLLNNIIHEKYIKNRNEVRYPTTYYQRSVDTNIRFTMATSSPKNYYGFSDTYQNESPLQIKFYDYDGYGNYYIQFISYHWDNSNYSKYHHRCINLIPMNYSQMHPDEMKHWNNIKPYLLNYVKENTDCHYCVTDYSSELGVCGVDDENTHNYGRLACKTCGQFKGVTRCDKDENDETNHEFETINKRCKNCGIWEWFNKILISEDDEEQQKQKWDEYSGCIDDYDCTKNKHIIKPFCKDSDKCVYIRELCFYCSKPPRINGEYKDPCTKAHRFKTGYCIHCGLNNDTIPCEEHEYDHKYNDFDICKNCNKYKDVLYKCVKCVFETDHCVKCGLRKKRCNIDGWNDRCEDKDEDGVNVKVPCIYDSHHCLKCGRFSDTYKILDSECAHDEHTLRCKKCYQNETVPSNCVNNAHDFQKLPHLSNGDDGAEPTEPTQIEARDTQPELQDKPDSTDTKKPYKYCVNCGIQEGYNYECSKHEYVDMCDTCGLIIKDGITKCESDKCRFCGINKDKSGCGEYESLTENDKDVIHCDICGLFYGRMTKCDDNSCIYVYNNCNICNKLDGIECCGTNNYCETCGKLKDVNCYQHKFKCSKNGCTNDNDSTTCKDVTCQIENCGYNKTTAEAKCGTCVICNYGYIKVGEGENEKPKDPCQDAENCRTCNLLKNKDKCQEKNNCNNCHIKKYYPPCMINDCVNCGLCWGKTPCSYKCKKCERILTENECIDNKQRQCIICGIYPNKTNCDAKHEPSEEYPDRCSECGIYYDYNSSGSYPHDHIYSIHKIRGTGSIYCEICNANYLIDCEECIASICTTSNCKNCGLSYNINMCTSHPDFVNAACINCGFKKCLNDCKNGNHDYSGYKCKTCGLFYGENKCESNNHEFVAGECTICGFKEDSGDCGENHDYSGYKCKTCGLFYNENKCADDKHLMNQDGECTTCGFKESLIGCLTNTDHDYTGKCIHCGSNYTSKEAKPCDNGKHNYYPHNYLKEGDKVCIKCGFIKDSDGCDGNHVYSTENTCINCGLKQYCDDCGEENHIYITNSDCIKCGFKDGSGSCGDSHTYTDGRCTECYLFENQTLCDGNHDFIKINCCKNCGFEDGKTLCENGEHNYSGHDFGEDRMKENCENCSISKEYEYENCENHCYRSCFKPLDICDDCKAKIQYKPTQKEKETVLKKCDKGCFDKYYNETCGECGIRRWITNICEEHVFNNHNFTNNVCQCGLKEYVKRCEDGKHEFRSYCRYCNQHINYADGHDCINTTDGHDYGSCQKCGIIYQHKDSSNCTHSDGDNPESTACVTCGLKRFNCHHNYVKHSYDEETTRCVECGIKYGYTIVNSENYNIHKEHNYYKCVFEDGICKTCEIKWEVFIDELNNNTSHICKCDVVHTSNTQCLICGYIKDYEDPKDGDGNPKVHTHIYCKHSYEDEICIKCNKVITNINCTSGYSTNGKHRAREYCNTSKKYASVKCECEDQVKDHKYICEHCENNMNSDIDCLCGENQIIKKIKNNYECVKCGKYKRSYGVDCNHDYSGCNYDRDECFNCGRYKHAADTKGKCEHDNSTWNCVNCNTKKNYQPCGLGCVYQTNYCLKCGLIKDKKPCADDCNNSSIICLNCGYNKIKECNRWEFKFCNCQDCWRFHKNNNTQEDIHDRSKGFDECACGYNVESRDTMVCLICSYPSHSRSNNKCTHDNNWFGKCIGCLKPSKLKCGECDYGFEKTTYCIGCGQRKPTMCSLCNYIKPCNIENGEEHVFKGGECVKCNSGQKCECDNVGEDGYCNYHKCEQGKAKCYICTYKCPDCGMDDCDKDNCKCKNCGTATCYCSVCGHKKNSKSCNLYEYNECKCNNCNVTCTHRDNLIYNNTCMICGKTVYESMGNLEQQYTKQTNEIKQLLTQLNRLMGYLNTEIKEGLTSDGTSTYGVRSRESEFDGNSVNFIQNINDMTQALNNIPPDIKGTDQRGSRSLRDDNNGDCQGDVNCTILEVINRLEKQLEAISFTDEQISNIKTSTGSTLTNLNSISETINKINGTINDNYLSEDIESYFGEKINEFITNTGIKLDKDDSGENTLMNNKLITLLLLVLEKELKDDFAQTQVDIIRSRPSNRVKLNQSGYKQVKKLLQEDK